MEELNRFFTAKDAQEYTDLYKTTNGFTSNLPQSKNKKEPREVDFLDRIKKGSDMLIEENSELLREIFAIFSE